MSKSIEKSVIRIEAIGKKKLRVQLMRREWWSVIDGWIIEEVERKIAGVWQSLRPLYFPVKKSNTEERTAIILFTFPQIKWFFGVISSCLNFSYQIHVLSNA